MSMFLNLTTDKQFLEEIYRDQSFIKKLHAQLTFLQGKVPTIMAFLNYFQGRVPHVTQAHGKMERLLHYLQAKTSLGGDLLFCSEEGCNFTCTTTTTLYIFFLSQWKLLVPPLSKEIAFLFMFMCIPTEFEFLTPCVSCSFIDFWIVSPYIVSLKIQLVSLPIRDFQLCNSCIQEKRSICQNKCI